MRHPLLLAALGLVALAPLAPAARAQSDPTTYEAAPAGPSVPRFGLAFNGLVAIPDGLGVGLRGRAATALNPDLSLALDVGATGFIVGGNRGADYVIDPQFSVIINLNSAKTYNPGLPTRQTYLIAGAGAYIPVGEERDESAGGATLHAGLGWVQPLTTTSVFYEFDPALVIGGKNDVGVTVPFRVGLIF